MQQVWITSSPGRHIQGVKRRTVLEVIFSRKKKINQFFCFVVAILNLAHDVKTIYIHSLC